MRTSGNVTASKGSFKAPAFSRKKYADLLAKTVPAVIANDEEYDRMEAVFNGLIDKGEEYLSPEETRLFALLANLLEEYEERTLPALKTASPAEALRFLMEENELKQVDLEDVFGSQSAVSRALNGSRRIGIDRAKRLAKRFKVSAELFF